uniref:ATP-binding cassette sub-family G member 2-like n=1 Tax=Phallusia mammillata TaxID=59560 RepID=A0A6F9D4Z9_9ASCI|nr:ATP-binding cassette sub-family G member 2-like [Phallusia mammillata]
MSKQNDVVPMHVRNDSPDNLSNISLDIESSEKLKGPNAVMSFHNINYNVNVKSGCCKSNPKQVLNNVSGVMKPGLNAIMGPTGSGKSSLLDILAGRKDPNGLSGLVLVDGRPLPSNFKRISGYVVQHDIVLGTLTVRENLWFSANLRLPRSISHNVKSKRIDEVLFDLGLTGCADTKIGNEMIRGVSGGEKKRASIGMELITSPSVLFLDEPTTGLDASTANAVMVLLKRLANRGRTIILSIHQPRYSIFRLFDSLTLLSLGHLVYHGPYDKALPYFESIGYQCEEHNNPADFFLDVINGDSTALARANHGSNAVVPVLKTTTASSEVDEITEAQATSLAEQLAEKFSSCDIQSSTETELATILKQSQGNDGTKISGHDTKTYATPFWYQFGILARRAFKNVIRNPFASIGNLVLNLIVGVVFGLLYYQVDNSATTGTQNRFGVLFFIATNLLFSSISAIEVFVKEKDIFIHEYVSGYYKVISYFLSKLVADLIPMRTIAPIIFCSVTYWMVGLKAEPASFFIFVLFVLLTGYAAVSIALFYSATFSTFAVASIFISLTFVFSILFAGLLLNVESVLPWLAWIEYISVAQYAYSGLCVNEFRFQTFQQCGSLNDTAFTSSILQFASAPDLNLTNNADGVTACYQISGEEFLVQRLGYPDTNITDWDLWLNVVALGCITLGMFTLTYIQLVRTKVYT